MELFANQRRWARTKIVATVGPASAAPEKLTELAQAGVDVFRLNMAHGDPATAQLLVDRNPR
jgi:pyruvate kinase